MSELTHISKGVQAPELPADVLTACLTTPLKMAIRWHVAARPSGRAMGEAVLSPMFTGAALDYIPGKVE
jgi:hypothetical protein